MKNSELNRVSELLGNIEKAEVEVRDFYLGGYEALRRFKQELLAMDRSIMSDQEVYDLLLKCQPFYTVGKKAHTKILAKALTTGLVGFRQVYGFPDMGVA